MSFCFFTADPDDTMRPMKGLKHRIQSACGRSPDRYFFISGVKKSGTNWAANLLRTHPRVVVWDELHFRWFSFHWDSYVRWTRGQIPPGEAKDLKARIMDEILENRKKEYFSHHKRRGGGYFFGDHSTGEPEAFIPGAKYIHMIRDPRDVIVSAAYHAMRCGEYPPEIGAELGDSIEQWKRDPWYFHQRPEALLHPREVERIARDWCRVVSIALEFRDKHPQDTLLLTYEDLHRNVEGGRNRLFEFLGLNPRQASPIPGMSMPAFSGRGENPAVFFRKGIIGDYKNYDTPMFRETVAAIAGPLMEKLCYAAEPDTAGIKR